MDRTLFLLTALELLKEKGAVAHPLSIYAVVKSATIPLDASLRAVKVYSTIT